MGLMQTLLNVLAKGHNMTPSYAAELFDRSRNVAQNALAKLALRGFALSVCGAYAATPQGVSFIESGAEIKSGPRGPHGTPRIVNDSLRIKVWRAIRIKGKFGLDDLARSVLDGSETAQDPLNNISRYVSALTATGYLIEMKRRTPGIAPTSPGKKRWMLVRDTGPQAPIRRGNGDVYDRNEKRLYQKGGSDDLA
ncbi:MAG: hypothetical protein ACYCY1_12595 [Sulfuriferula sp.]